MAGLPWVVVFALVAWLALSRGWMWLLVASVFCMGVFAGGTTVGEAIAGTFASALSGAYGLLTSLLAGAAR